jgi:hypothetical protein
MAGLVPAIHVFSLSDSKDVDARHKAGHDEERTFARVSKDEVGISSKIFQIFSGNFSVTLTLRSDLLRRRFEFERCCSHMRQTTPTKREQGLATVNERLRKALCPRA